jgi:hypothetical protein
LEEEEEMETVGRRRIYLLKRFDEECFRHDVQECFVTVNQTVACNDQGLEIQHF